MSIAEIISKDKSCWQIKTNHPLHDFERYTSRSERLNYVVKERRKNREADWKIFRYGNINIILVSDIIEEKFLYLAEQWKIETKGLSQAASKINNNNYLSIIGLGIINPEKITKLILNDLRNGSSYWHYALKKINNVNPVPKGLDTSIEKTRDYWLAWGDDNNKF